jgi:hypothetical protein
MLCCTAHMQTLGAAKLLVYNSEQAHDQIRGATPAGTRTLNLILNDAIITKADPNRALAKQLMQQHMHFRLSDVKLLRKASPCFKGVPSIAVDRFLQLVSMYDITKGKCQHLCSYICVVSSLHINCCLVQYVYMRMAMCSFYTLCYCCYLNLSMR